MDGSGGGSLNIFYEETFIKGTVLAAGGSRGTISPSGGAGGAGSISIGSLATGTYVEYVEDITTE